MVLADPSDPDRMYLSLDGKVPLARPLLFGDVIRDVPCVRGGDAVDYAMLLTHPCSMRRGPRLRDTIVTGNVQVSRHQHFKGAQWSISAFDYLPLNEFPDAETKRVVDFTALHAAPSARLQPENRVLALSDYGIAVTLQRWIYQMSRDPVPLDDLAELVAPVLAEADIQEEWCDAALSTRAGDDPMTVIAEATVEVQEVLGETSGDSYRMRLKDPAERSSVRRQIAQLRAERFAGA